MSKRLKNINTPIDYRWIKAEWEALELDYDELAAKSMEMFGKAPSRTTIARFRRGDVSLRVSTIIWLSALMGIEPQVSFKRISNAVLQGTA